jgi:uncharacterized protein YcbK (DUF882 family)
MVPILIKLKLMTTAMAGWTAASSPAPLPAQSVATVVAVDSAAPIAVSLFDENEHQHGTIAIWRDGSTDAATSTEVKQLFRCRTTHRQKMMAKKTLAMLADIAQHYPGKTIEYVSAYRTGRHESATSPHRDGTYTDVGVGWYPSEQFIHIDTRPKIHDTSWTFYKGVNHYHPYWAELARRPQLPVAASTVPRAGV